MNINFPSSESDILYVNTYERSHNLEIIYKCKALEMMNDALFSAI